MPDVGEIEPGRTGSYCSLSRTLMTSRCSSAEPSSGGQLPDGE